MCCLKHFSVALLVPALFACSGTAPRDLRPWEKAQAVPAAVETTEARTLARQGYGPKLTEGEPYTVKRGDTLYAIAFRLGLDFRELAARNNIKAPYTIKVGQTLSTAKPSAQASQKASGALVSKKSTASSKSQSVKTSKQTTRPSAVTTRAVARWRWPSKGQVSRRFTANVHKGIDIAGRRGESVTATAAGKVVYAGAGVKGYGSLIIIKHNDTYLSAYGHNEQLLVSEGSVVKVGQQIATMGSSGTNSVKLHFELRRLGKPVDPLTLLPAR
mgnify:CR=1 FL=1